MKEPKHVKTMFHRCSPSFSDWGWGGLPEIPDAPQGFPGVMATASDRRRFVKQMEPKTFELTVYLLYPAHT